MIEQPATVAAVRSCTVWVRRCETAPRCAACSAGTGCGAGWLLRCFGGRPAPLIAIPHGGVFTVGEPVIVSIAERSLLSAAATVYGAPLAGLMLGAALGELAAGNAGAMLAGGAGLLLGGVIAVLLSNRLARACRVRVRAGRSRARRRSHDYWS